MLVPAPGAPTPDGYRPPTTISRPKSGAWSLADRADYGPSSTATAVGPAMAPNNARSAQSSATPTAGCLGAVWEHGGRGYSHTASITAAHRRHYGCVRAPAGRGGVRSEHTRDRRSPLHPKPALSRRTTSFIRTTVEMGFSS